jgi:predicted Zn finger-like uncharacterized protein
MDRMRIACPSCGAEYDVPDRLLAGSARTLRCSRCTADFALPGAAAPAVAPPAVAPPAPPPPLAAVATAPALPKPEVAPLAPAVPARAPVAGPPTRDDAALRKAWVASLAVVAGGILALVVWRGPVMAAWPPATRLFAALGLA